MQNQCNFELRLTLSCKLFKKSGLSRANSIRFAVQLTVALLAVANESSLANAFVVYARCIRAAMMATFNWINQENRMRQ